MPPIDSLFDRMDAWRHFPNYQLERRADIFFALYLPEVLEARFGFPLSTELIPEFPVRIGTIYEGCSSDKSYKIDYLALSTEVDQAVFVELKTDGRSKRPEQDKYLEAVQNTGLVRLLYGLLDIFRATNAKRKYFCLLKQLEKIGLLRIPAALHEIMKRPSLQGANEASGQIEIAVPSIKSRVVYILPNGTGPDVISFHEFADVVGRHEDPVAQRFSRSLREWAAVRAGEEM